MKYMTLITKEQAPKGFGAMTFRPRDDKSQIPGLQNHMLLISTEKLEVTEHILNQFLLLNDFC